MWQRGLAPAVDLECCGELTDRYLFAKDPPDEHAVMVASPDSVTAYGGRAVISEFPELVPLVKMVVGARETGRLEWHCTCGYQLWFSVSEGRVSTITRRICEQFDDHVGHFDPRPPASVPPPTV